MNSPKLLHTMFTAVPPRYDFVNHVITLGLDARWRKLAARECLMMAPKRFLDLGCGTADLLREVARGAHAPAELIGVDYSRPMLELAARKVAALGAGPKISFQVAEAAKLPFPDEHFDCVGISFAFRNLTYKNPLFREHVAEVWRVLRPGGRFVIVESSQPGSRLVRGLFHLYLGTVVYYLGRLISGNRQAYRYLAESARRYYTPDEVAGLLKTAGFSSVSYRPLLFGAAGIHVALR